jgi:hypothetical protein
VEELRFDRLCRTASSEAYLISSGEEPVARIEIHFTAPIVYGLLIVEKPLGEEEITDMIEKIDTGLIWGVGVQRDDFVVTVYQGQQLGVYSDPDESKSAEADENNAGERR